METALAESFGLVLNMHNLMTLIFVTTFVEVWKRCPAKNAWLPLITWVLAVGISGASAFIFDNQELDVDLVIGGLIGCGSIWISDVFNKTLGLATSTTQEIVQDIKDKGDDNNEGTHS